MAARVVVEHLLKLGHRKVAVAAGGYAGEQGTYAAVSAEACRHLLEVTGAQYVPHYTFPDGNRDLLLRRIKAEGVTAYWDLNDAAAVISIRRCQEQGLRVPEDVSIAGRFDTPWCELASPALTSLSIDPEATARTLREATEAPPDAGAIRLVPPRLVARASTGPAPHR
ncbi:MAG: substrate-binding domain-containing protein [Planctomycetota bacterium]|nr:substrate-binding domain-containing protein [Planctomycetota bacterium]